MGEVLVDDDSLDQKRVLQRPAHLAVDLDQLEVDVFSLEVGDRHDGVDGDLCELVMCLGNDLAAQACPCHLEEVLGLVLAELDGVGDLVQLRHCYVTGLVVAVCDADGVDSLVDQLGSLLEQSTGQDNNTRGAVSYLVIL